MKYILIDTSTYESEGFNFNQGYLKIVEKLCIREDIQLLTHSIIDNEIRSHIAEKVATFRAGVKQLIEKSYLFYENSSYDILKKFDDAWYEKNKFLSYECFLENANPIYLKNDDISIDLVVKDYMKGEPPFGNGKKKNEFPDAIVLNSVSKFKFEPDDELYLISEDQDWMKYANKHSMTCYKTLFDFMSSVMSEEEQNLIYTDALDKWIKRGNNYDDVEELILKELISFIEKKHDDYDELDDESTVEEIKDIECIYFDTKKKEISFQVVISCNINYLLCYNDFDNAIYDREDHQYYNVQYVKKQFDDTVTGVAIINVNFETNDKNVYIKKINDLELFQLDEDDFKFTRIEEPEDYDF